MYRHRRETLLVERSAYIGYEQGNVFTGNTEDCAEVNIPPVWSGAVIQLSLSLGSRFPGMMHKALGVFTQPVLERPAATQHSLSSFP